MRHAATLIVFALLIVAGLGRLPIGGGSAPAGRAAPAALDCSIFASQADAQAVLGAGPVDPSTLDPDGDGVACDELLTGEEPAAPEVVASPPAGTPGATPGATPLATPTPVPTPSVALEALLPVAEEVPFGLVVERDDRRRRAEVAYQLSGQLTDEAARAEADDQLAAWRFDGAIVRYFGPDQTPLPEAPDQPPPPPPSGIRWLWVAAYRFRDPAATPEAYEALIRAAQAADERLQPVEIAPIGSEADAFVACDAADGLFHVWFRTEFDVVWIAGTASAGFPQADVEALARIVELRAGGEAPGTNLRVGGIVAPVSPANLRAEPSTAALIVTVLPPGALLVVTGPPVPNPAEGRDWWPVEVIATGEIGFVAAELLVPAG